MSFTTYTKYKDSCVRWLGEVPEHWDTRRIRTLFEIKKRIAGTLGFDVFSITQNGIRVKDIESNEGQQSMDYSQYQLVETGDFAMNPMDLITGGADIATSRGVTSPDYRVCSFRDPAAFHARYFVYLFQKMYREKIFFHLGQGSSQLGRWRLPRDEFNNFVFPVPSLLEQTRIVAFLDRETARIDGLVAQQRRLMELLKEKRQAVISHAVTKGLNPRAPMKPSGIEWLGDVPEHWNIRKLSHLTTAIGDGLHGTPAYVDESDFRFINGNNLMTGRIQMTESTRCVSEDEFNRHCVELDDSSVLMSINGTVGNLALFHGERVMLSKSAAYINCADTLCREFLFYYLQSSEVRAPL